MNGILVINKKSGLSSSHVVQKVKKILHEKCGHLGTLDPLAEGVLPVAVGRATRLFDLFLSKTKTYVAQIRFGLETDTLDNEGKVTKVSQIIPSLDEINQAIKHHLLGEINQMPPLYSSKKVNGAKAYDLARKGISVELKPSQVTIFSFDVLSPIDECTIEARIVCSAGTYIRSLCRDLGILCHSCAIMHHLIREKCGPFDISQSVDVDELSLDNVMTYIVPLKEALRGHPSVDLDESIFKDCLNGKVVHMSQINGLGSDISSALVVFVKGEVVGLAKIQDDVFKIITYLC